MGYTGRAPGRSVGVERLVHSRDIALTGDVSGSVSFDATANVAITATVADDSHNHIISNVDGLQTALDAKAPIASPTFTGTVSGVTKTMVGLGSVDNTADSAKNVLSATKLATARTIGLSGDVTGSASFNGSANATITATVVDNTLNISKLNATGTRNDSTFLAGDNTFKEVAVTPTAVSDQANSSTGFFAMSSGTTAQRPGSPAIGYTRFNTDLDAMENYTAAGWLKVSISFPSLISVDGTIGNGLATTLTLNGTQFGTAAGTVRFTSGATTEDVSVTPTSTVLATVAVPAAIYNLSSGTTFSVKFINSDGGQSNTVNKTVTAIPTGGTITTSGGYRIHTFTSSGTFATNDFSGSVQYVVVAGGAGGARLRTGGGGGAGGYRSSVSGESSGGGASAESALLLSPNTAYTVTVGAGGSAGANGSNSVFSSIISTGGGAGGDDSTYSGTQGSGFSGGSGGGSRSNSSGVGGAGTSGQGYRGGNNSTGTLRGTGGGGAGATGNNVGSGDTGIGGIGVQSSINGTATYRAGGGGGGSSESDNPAGGNGGGGSGANAANTGATAGGTNTGGGGGGGGGSAGASAGGSGIVIVRYQLT